MNALQPASRYDPVAVTLHWVIAISILIMIPLGIFIDEFPVTIRFDVVIFHKSLGLCVLGLSVFRLIWRFLNPPPALPDSMTRAEKFMAEAVHAILYGLMIAMPLTGWLMVSASHKYPTIFFWAGEVPFIPMPAGIDEKATAHSFRVVHYWLGIGALALIAGHAGAALKHHFVTKDGVLYRMLPKFLIRGNHA